MSETKIQEHPLLSKLGTVGATNATSLSGYVGPSGNEETVRLYSSLEDLSDSVEVLRKDILHSAPTPDTVLPYGGTIIWLTKDSHVTFHRSEKTVVATSGETNLLEVNRGRLRIRVPGTLGSEVCTSRCKVCTSRCGVCHSGGAISFANRFERSR